MKTGNEYIKLENETLSLILNYLHIICSNSESRNRSFDY